MAKLKYNPMKTVRWFETADHLKIYAYLPWDTYYTPVRNAIAETLTDKNIPHKSLREVDLPFTQEETKQCYVITVDKEDFQAKFSKIGTKITAITFSEEGKAIRTAIQPDYSHIDIRKASDNIPTLRSTGEMSHRSKLNDALLKPTQTTLFKRPQGESAFPKRQISLVCKEHLPIKKRLLQEYLEQRNIEEKTTPSEGHSL